MKGPWTYRRMVRRDDAQIVWPIYRLRDADGADVETNREYYAVGRYRAWATDERGAETYARIFNAVRQ